MDESVPYLEDLVFKITRSDGSPLYGKGKWSLPKNGKPGAWRILRNLDSNPLWPCHRGFHFCGYQDVYIWRAHAANTRVFLAEVDGTRMYSGHKFVVYKARLIKELRGIDLVRLWDSRYRADWIAWLGRNGVKVR